MRTKNNIIIIIKFIKIKKWILKVFYYATNAIDPFKKVLMNVKY